MIIWDSYTAYNLIYYVGYNLLLRLNPNFVLKKKQFIPKYYIFW